MTRKVFHLNIYKLNFIWILKESVVNWFDFYPFDWLNTHQYFAIKYAYWKFAYTVSREQELVNPITWYSFFFVPDMYQIWCFKHIVISVHKVWQYAVNYGHYPLDTEQFLLCLTILFEYANVSWIIEFVKYSYYEFHSI